MFNSVQILVHLDNFRHNLKLLQSKHPNAMPVIKADAYGHGVVPVARTLVEEGVQQLAVGAVREGVQLRKQLDDLKADTFLLALMGLSISEDAALAASYNVAPLIHNVESLQKMAAISKTLRHKPMPIALKFDTGMSRLGFKLADMGSLVELLRSLPELNPHLVLTHLASADVEAKDEDTKKQGAEFAEVSRSLRQAFPAVKDSVLNSPGILAWTQLGGDISRPGISLYGANPLYKTSREHLGAGLKSTMSILTSVMSVHALSKGTALSYGGTFVAPKDMQVAVLGIGYSDGYLRSASGKGQVLLNGQRAPILGRVCMQMCMVDISHIPHVQVGQWAYMLGGSGPQSIKPEEVAEWWDSIPHEVFCSLGKNEHVSAKILDL